MFEQLEENWKFVESALALVDNHALWINHILIVVVDDDATRLGASGGVESVKFRRIYVDVPAVNGGEVEGGLVAELHARRIHETSHVPVG